MGVPFAKLVEIATELVGGSSGAVGIGVIDSEWVKTGEFLNLLVLSDHSTARLICSVRGYGPRKTFLTDGLQEGIAHGAQLNLHDGPLESVYFVISGGNQAGTHRATAPRGADLNAMLAELVIENRNVTNNPEIRPHYVEDGGTIYHNQEGLERGGATDVSVNATFPLIPAIDFTITSSICPDEFAEPICLNALGLKFGHDGDRLQAAGFYTQRADALRALGIQA